MMAAHLGEEGSCKAEAHDCSGWNGRGKEAMTRRATL